MLNRVQFTIGPAVGDAGSASAVGQSAVVSGLIVSVGVFIFGTPPATTDVTLVDAADDFAESIVSLADTDVGERVYPARQMQTNAGVPIDGLYTEYAVHGALQGAVEQTDPGVTVTFDVLMRMY